MTPAEFEQELVRRFPALANEVAQDPELLHVHMGTLYRYAQEQISASRWSEVERVFRFVEDAYMTSRPGIEIENAIRVSFVEYFEFQGHEDLVRQLLGSVLVALHDDQRRYVEDLTRRATEQEARRDSEEPRR